MLFPLLAGEDLTGTRYASDLDNVGLARYQISDGSASNGSTAFIDSTDLVVPLADFATYVFRSTLWFVSSASADIKIRFTLPIGSFGRVKWGDTTLDAEDDASDELIQGFSTNGGLQAISPSGFVTTDITPDDLIVGYAQNTAHGSNTVLKLASHIIVTRLA